MELESELHLGRNKLQEKEAELQALKDGVKRLAAMSSSAFSDVAGEVLEATLTPSEAVLSALPSPLIAEAQMLRDGATSHFQARNIFGGNYRLNNRRNRLGLDRHRKKVVVKRGDLVRPATRGEVWKNPRQKTETLEAATAIQSRNREEISRIRVQSIWKSNPRAAIEIGEGKGELGLTQFGAGPAIEIQVRIRYQLGPIIGVLGFLLFWFLGVSGVKFWVGRGREIFWDSCFECEPGFV